MIAHIVFFNPKPNLSRDELLAFATCVHESSRDIPSIAKAMVGPARDVGAAYAHIDGQMTYKYAAVMEFDGKEGLLAYLRHPLHTKLGRMFWESCDSTQICDVELRDAKSHELINFLLEDLERTR